MWLVWLSLWWFLQTHEKSWNDLHNAREFEKKSSTIKSFIHLAITICGTLKDLSVMNRVLWDRRCLGATRLRQRTRLFAPRALIDPCGPYIFTDDITKTNRNKTYHREIMYLNKLYRNELAQINHNCLQTFGRLSCVVANTPARVIKLTTAIFHNYCQEPAKRWDFYLGSWNNKPWN